MQLARFPRFPLAHLPTPLERLERLERHLGGPELWIKRDDATGLATGGNKTRKLEFLVGEALDQGADVLVTQGAVQSNHVRQTAAAAARAGLACHALLERRVPDTANDYEVTGNVLLDRLLGAQIEFRPPGADMNAEAEALGRELAAEGRRPYVIPGGGSNPVGATGYAACARELVVQADEIGLEIDAIVVASGSAGTHAGLIAGLTCCSAVVTVHGVSVRHPRVRQIPAVYELACDTVEHLGGPPDVTRDDVIVHDEYVGEGYGIPTPGTLEAVRMLAELEGILLDPVYTGKAMAGLIDLARRGLFRKGETVVFLHTGGSASLFAYSGALVRG